MYGYKRTDGYVACVAKIHPRSAGDDHFGGHCTAQKVGDLFDSIFLHDWPEKFLNVFTDSFIFQEYIINCQQKMSMID